MNDEEVLSFDQSEESEATCDSNPEEVPHREDDGGLQADPPQESDGCTAQISDTDLQDPDPYSLPDPAPASEDPAGSELAELRSELHALREELNRERALRSRLGAEYEEFQILYPETPLASLSDSVWEDVRRGIPIAAAFALAEKRRLRTETLAKESNLSNTLRSSGAMTPSQTDYFSPDEVRAMSPDEVRKYYKQIRSSMKSWH